MRNDIPTAFLHAEELTRHKTTIAEQSHRDTAGWRDCNPAHRSVVQSQTQPSFGGKLEGSDEAVPNDVAVTDNNCVRVFSLRRVSSVKDFTKSYKDINIESIANFFR